MNYCEKHKCESMGNCLYCAIEKNGMVKVEMMVDGELRD